MTRTVYIEESGTPIYARIAKAVGRELQRLEFNVLVLQPAAFTHESFIAFLQREPDTSVYLTNAGSNIVQGRLPGQLSHYFEHFPGRVVFLHQDSVLSGSTFEQALARLQGWQRLSSRSAHLCIEPHNVTVLQQAGIRHVKWVPHASEVAPTAPLTDGFDHSSSFVGHVVPSIYRQSSGSASVDALMQNLFQRRQTDMSAQVETELAAFSAQALSCLGASPDNALFLLAHTLWLRGQFMHQSLQFRGWVFEQAQIDSLKIFGGDPAYLHGVDRSLRIERESIAYEAAVYDPEALGRIFRGSRVNINVSSLQFDHAVVNRFHDVVMSGGLCLTDRRVGLADLTRHHAALSFATVQELEEKVRYYSDPKRASERAALICEVQQEVVERSGYPLLAHEIRQVIDTLMP
jgi:hypothetical protein